MVKKKKQVVSFNYKKERGFNKIFQRLLITMLFFIIAIPSFALEGLVKFSSNPLIPVFLEVAVTDEEKSRGLMNRPSLENNRGMVFVFRPQRKVTFWMKDTLISLDMIFINNGRIVKIVKNAEPNQTSILYPSDFDVTEVIEVNSGYSDANNISVGDKITFENIAQIDYSKNSRLMIVAK